MKNLMEKLKNNKSIVVSYIGLCIPVMIGTSAFLAYVIQDFRSGKFILKDFIAILFLYMFINGFNLFVNVIVLGSFYDRPTI